VTECILQLLHYRSNSSTKILVELFEPFGISRRCLYLLSIVYTWLENVNVTEVPVWSVLCDFQTVAFQRLKLHVYTPLCIWKYWIKKSRRGRLYRNFREMYTDPVYCHVTWKLSENTCVNLLVNIVIIIFISIDLPLKINL
jgi:hypothetical protein